MKEDFEKQLKQFQEKAAREQEQTNLLLQEERRRAAMEKKLAQDGIKSFFSFPLFFFIS